MALGLQDAAIRDGLRPLVTRALIAEHRRAPFGPHSPDLTRVLDFLRRNPDPELPRYLVLDEGACFRIAMRAPDREAPPLPADAERFPDRAAAEHGVFLRRLRDYGLLA
jgi:hypothetical protein